MSEIKLGKTYYVVLPLTDDGQFDDREINRALGLPEDLIFGDNWEISMLDVKRVTVMEVGLLTDGQEPGALVRVGKVRWDRPITVTLTAEQMAEIGPEHFTPGATYRITGRVFGVDEEYGIGPERWGGAVEIPYQDTRLIPTAWLRSKHPGRLAAFPAAR